MRPPIQNKIIRKQKVNSTVKSSRQFDIDTYLDTKFLIYFKNTIENVETNLAASGISEEMKKKFYVYITVNNQTPNADLTRKLDDEISSIKTSNGNYIYFLAKLLIYIVDDVLKKEEANKTKILNNIRTFLTTIEENSITGIFNMHYGINSSFYNDFKDNNNKDTEKYLFHIKFLNDYKTLFTDKLEEIYINPKYNLCTNNDDINECNTISNSHIINLIEHLLPEHGGQKIYKKVKLLKKYKS